MPTQSATARSGVFSLYWPLWPLGHPVWMACLTEDTAALVRAEPGVRIRDTKDGLVIRTHKGDEPIEHGDYVVRYGSLVAVLAGKYVHENYTTERD